MGNKLDELELQPPHTYEVYHGFLFDDTLDGRHFILVFVNALNGNVNPDLNDA